VSEPDYLDCDDEPDFPRHGKMIVFGGNGFVGQEVCRTMAQRGYDVISISRTGERPWHTTHFAQLFRAPDCINYTWADKVTWLEGNAAEPNTYKHLLKTDDPSKPFLGVVSCVGAFFNAREINGEVNKKLIEACADAKVPRFCYVSGLPPPPPISLLLGGYLAGKKTAEDALVANFPENGCAIRAPALLGTRWILNMLPFTMWYPLLPLRILGNIVREPYLMWTGLHNIFQKPMHVEHLASACSNFLERPAHRVARFKGVVEDHWEIRKLSNSFTDYYAMEQRWHFIR